MKRHASKRSPSTTAGSLDGYLGPIPGSGIVEECLWVVVYLMKDYGDQTQLSGPLAGIIPAVAVDQQEVTSFQLRFTENPRTPVFHVRL